jgi:acetyl esterase
VAVHSQVQALLEELIAAGLPSSMSLPLPEGRRNFAELFASLEETEEVERVEDLSIPGPAGDVPVRLYHPARSADGDGGRPMVAFFHGGGWVFGGIDTHDGLCRMLANASAAVLASVEYRLAPEHPYPAALDDCVAATRWLHDRAGDLGCDPSRLAVAGDSAGGNLAAAVALRARDEGGPALRFQALLYPVLDPTLSTASYAEHADDPFLSREEMAWYWDQYLGPGGDARSDPLAAPARAMDLSGLPAAVVVTAEYDVLRDEGEAFAERLGASGVATTLLRNQGMIHGFLSMGRHLDASRVGIAEVGACLSAALG